MRQKRKKRRILILKLIVIALIVYLTIAVFFSVMGSNIRNIHIIDNQYLTDQEIIDIARLTDYPSFFQTPSFAIRNRLLASDFIKDVRVRKGWYNRVTIYVTENRPLLSKDNYLVLEDGTLVEDNGNFSVPRLVNHVPDIQFSVLVESLSEIQVSILRKISEIEYTPNEIDDRRFLLHMNDGNIVYVNLDRFERIDQYDRILPTLEGKKGILYLDFGSHFEVRIE